MAAPAFQPKQRIIYFQGAKIMQTSAIKACFQIAECRLSYAKIQQKVENQ